ncbi:hypothetical protein EDC01DRAFT_635204 [Geopyxis carbonaria]|nr:hypothetical protein EDC01DRAFT_635204 [Geopyxis carbonaria]
MPNSNSDATNLQTEKDEITDLPRSEKVRPTLRSVQTKGSSKKNNRSPGIPNFSYTAPTPEADKTVSRVPTSGLYSSAPASEDEGDSIPFETATEATPTCKKPEPLSASGIKSTTVETEPSDPFKTPPRGQRCFDMLDVYFETAPEGALICAPPSPPRVKKKKSALQMELRAVRKQIEANKDDDPPCKCKKKVCYADPFEPGPYKKQLRDPKENPMENVTSQPTNVVFEPQKVEVPEPTNNALELQSVSGGTLDRQKREFARLAEAANALKLPSVFCGTCDDPEDELERLTEIERLFDQPVEEDVDCISRKMHREYVQRRESLPMIASPTLVAQSLKMQREKRKVKAENTS